MSEDIEILVDPIDDVRFPPPRLTARAPGCADPRRALLRRRDLPRLAEPGDAVPGGRRRSGRVGMAGVHPATSHDPGSRYRRGELPGRRVLVRPGRAAVSYTHLRAHETVLELVCRLLL